MELTCAFKGHLHRPRCRGRATSFVVGRRLLWPVCSSCLSMYRRRAGRRALVLSVRDRSAQGMWVRQDPCKLREGIRTVDLIS